MPIVRPGHFHTFYLRQIIEIFVVYSKDPKLERFFFYFSKFWFSAEIQGFKVTSRLSTKADISGVDISGSIGYRNKGSSVLYSRWARDHLYSYWNNWITVSICQYRVKFWTPKILWRLDQLSKSVGSFGIRCGLRWVLGGLAGTISSWTVPEKPQKTPEKGDFLFQDHQSSFRPLLYVLFKEDIWNFYVTFFKT